MFGPKSPIPCPCGTHACDTSPDSIESRPPLLPNPLLVVLALAALLVGPALALVWSAGRAWRAVIDGLSLSLVGGICFLVVFPHAIEVAGLAGLLAILPGMWLPGWAHRLGERWERTFVYAGMVLLAVHAAIDGAALTLPGTSMGVAVVAHRLPMGLAVYSAASRASSGRRAGFSAVGILIVATIIGVFIGEPMSGIGGPIGHGAFEGFVGGLLLHIVFEHAPVFPAPEHPDLLGHGDHHGGHDHGHHHGAARQAAREGGNRWSALGAVLGLLVVGGLLASQGHDPHHHHAGASFTETVWALSLATAPWLVGGYALATVWIRLAARRSTVGTSPVAALQGLTGVDLGIRSPVCACEAVPMAHQQLADGMPQRTVIAFLLATPAVGFAGLMVSAGLLGETLTIVRWSAVLFLAVLAAVVMRAPSSPSAPAEPQPVGRRFTWAESARFGFVELVDHTLPWVVVGVLIGALAVVALPSLRLELWPSMAQVPVFTLLSVPLYVSATGATPTVVALVDHGLSMGAGVGLLIAGPMLNLPAIALLR